MLDAKQPPEFDEDEIISISGSKTTSHDDFNEFTEKEIDRELEEAERLLEKGRFATKNSIKRKWIRWYRVYFGVWWLVALVLGIVGIVDFILNGNETNDFFAGVMFIGSWFLLSSSCLSKVSCLQRGRPRGRGLPHSLLWFLELKRWF